MCEAGETLRVVKDSKGCGVPECFSCPEYSPPWLSSAKGACKGLLSLSNDLHIYVHDASKFERAGRYRLTVELCKKRTKGAPLPDLELRAYRPS